MLPVIRKTHRGFTLIELSIVLVIISMLAGMAFSVAAQKTRTEKQRQLVEKMDKIEAALKAYARQNATLPCPARPNNAVYASYASEYNASSTSIICSQAAWAATGTYKTQTAAVVTQPDGTTSNIIAGTLPTVTLGLADEVGIDPWGNQFTYAIDTIANAWRLNASGATSPYMAPFEKFTAAQNVGKIIVRDTAGQTLTSSAVAVIISHGPNGNGAFPYLNTSAVNRKLGGTDTNELKNCHCPASGVVANSSMDGIFIQGPTTRSTNTNADTFDDTTRYYLRSHFLTSYDLPAN